ESAISPRCSTTSGCARTRFSTPSACRWRSCSRRGTPAPPPLISVPPTATVRQALNLMSTYNVSQLPVLDGGDGVGAVAEPVLMARALEDPATLDRPVQDVMDAPYPVVDADLPVERLTTLLSRETPAALVRH